MTTTPVTVIDLENIKIPSINSKYQISPNTGRLFLSSPYRTFKRDLIAVCKKQRLDGPYGITIEIWTYKDIDNCIKVIIDAIQDAGVIDDDRDVLSLRIEKLPTKRGIPERLIVSVENIGEANR